MNGMSPGRRTDHRQRQPPGLLFTNNLILSIMSTCNFSTVNARRYYVVNDREYYNPETGDVSNEPGPGMELIMNDWDDILDELRESAKGREDGAQFTPVNERKQSYCRRDDGTVILEYAPEDMVLSPDYILNLTAQIILRPGYYQAANLDWDYYIYNGYGRDYLSDYNSHDGLIDSIIEDWDYTEERWSPGLKAMQNKNIRRKIDSYLNDLDERLEAICADLCGQENIYVCSARFSNGEAIYTKLNSPKGPIYEALGA